VPYDPVRDFPGVSGSEPDWLSVPEFIRPDPSSWAESAFRIAPTRTINTELKRLTGMRDALLREFPSAKSGRRCKVTAPEKVAARRVAAAEKLMDALKLELIHRGAPLRKEFVRPAPAPMPSSTGPNPPAHSKQSLAKAKVGRPKSGTVANRREGICRIASTGVTGERYCKAIDNAHLSTPLEWQKREKCSKSYTEAWNHPTPNLRPRWRKRIADEKSKATAASRNNS